ncbi:Vault protein inter-alpha-trypsin domain-containing protein [Desulfomicrobium apsheronum]|uniref:Vault protein inter-alpha-trypsin domain-containing protein n=1 Tax=Desulfomicrobium apsheronum TaxID=52560 RepID=A0A1I3X966_9BACT|nr:VIT domain-containing protein [Desulfomicrobium apsheronum]SFK15456.1 Vault protein inter-alpha-trypsin domain-containing protein [Desulfomicrobium apsheronum]
MYSDTTAPTLKTTDSRNVCLQGVDIRVDIHDYLAATRMTYIFVNSEDASIETVYTFPLPIDGVLTNLRVKIGQREMHGVAVEKSQAQEEYEQAVCDGDSPIMLERLDSGLYILVLPELLWVNDLVRSLLTEDADERHRTLRADSWSQSPLVC